MTSRITRHRVKAPNEWDIYCRLSKAIDGSFEKVETQESDCRVVAKLEGVNVGNVAVDNNLSAWKQNRSRPGWDETLRRIRDGKIGGVIAYHDDRLMRHPRDLEDLLDASEQCEERYGFGVVLLLGGLRFDLTDDNTKGDLRQRTLYAWREVANTSRRVKRKLDFNASQGKLKGVREAFGYEGRTSIPNREQVEVIREVARRVLDDGETWTQVSDDLNARGITTVAGNPWKRGALRASMSLTRHGGFVVYTDSDGNERTVAAQKPEGAADDLWPVLDRVTYDRLQGFISGAARGRMRTTRTLLSGIAKCGRCGILLLGASNTGKTSRMPDGSVRMTYRCPKDRGGCSMAVTAVYVDTIVRDAVLEWYAQRAPELEAQSHVFDAELATAREHLAALERNYAAMFGKLLAKGIDPEVAEHACEEVERSVERQRAKVSDLSGREAVSGRLATNAQERWDNEDTSVIERRRMIEQAVRSLVILPASAVGFVNKFNPERVKLELR